MKWGAGLRASQALVLGGKARALMHGRYHVSVEDIQALAQPILRHRIITNFYAESERITSDAHRRAAARGRAAAARAGCSAWPYDRARELRFLDPAVVARLGTLELKARTVVEGFLSGLHRSPFKGFSVEFAEYRQYLPGDDLVDDRLEGLRAQRPALRQEVRGGDQPRVPPAARRQRVDGATASARR